MTEYVEKQECDYRYGEIIAKLDKIIIDQQDTNKRLYQDNGRKSIQTILNEHGTVIKVIIWIVAAAVLATITSLVGLIIAGGIIK